MTPAEKLQRQQAEAQTALVLHALIQAGGMIRLDKPDLATMAGCLSAVSIDGHGAVIAQLLNAKRQPISTPNDEIRRIQRGALAALIARGGLWTTITDDEMTVNLDRDTFWKRGQGSATMWRVGEPRLAVQHKGLIMPNDGRVQ